MPSPLELEILITKAGQGDTEATAALARIHAANEKTAVSTRDLGKETNVLTEAQDAFGRKSGAAREASEGIERVMHGGEAGIFGAAKAWRALTEAMELNPFVTILVVLAALGPVLIDVGKWFFGVGEAAEKAGDKTEIAKQKAEEAKKALEKLDEQKLEALKAQLDAITAGQAAAIEQTKAWDDAFAKIDAAYDRARLAHVRYLVDTGKISNAEGAALTAQYQASSRRGTAINELQALKDADSGAASEATAKEQAAQQAEAAAKAAAHAVQRAAASGSPVQDRLNDQASKVDDLTDQAADRSALNAAAGRGANPTADPVYAQLAAAREELEKLQASEADDLAAEKQQREADKKLADDLQKEADRRRKEANDAKAKLAETKDINDARRLEINTNLDTEQGTGKEEAEVAQRDALKKDLAKPGAANAELADKLEQALRQTDTGKAAAAADPKLLDLIQRLKEAATRDAHDGNRANLSALYEALVELVPHLKGKAAQTQVDQQGEQLRQIAQQLNALMASG